MKKKQKIMVGEALGRRRGDFSPFVFSEARFGGYYECCWVFVGTGCLLNLGVTPFVQIAPAVKGEILEANCGFFTSHDIFNESPYDDPFETPQQAARHLSLKGGAIASLQALPGCKRDIFITLDFGLNDDLMDGLCRDSSPWSELIPRYTVDQAVSVINFEFRSLFLPIVEQVERLIVDI